MEKTKKIQKRNETKKKTKGEKTKQNLTDKINPDFFKI
jgi:hypothetical protein